MMSPKKLCVKTQEKRSKGQTKGSYCGIKKHAMMLLFLYNKKINVVLCFFFF
ncbi:hypothetical protein ACE6H2_020215 [Prunus campanulata]